MGVRRPDPIALSGVGPYISLDPKDSAARLDEAERFRRLFLQRASIALRKNSAGTPFGMNPSTKLNTRSGIAGGKPEYKMMGSWGFLALIAEAVASPSMGRSR